MGDAQPCVVPECVALAVTGETCSIHRDVARVKWQMNCVGCTRTIAAGKWHHKTATGED